MSKKKTNKTKSKNKASFSSVISTFVSVATSVVSATMLLFQKFPDISKLLGITFPIIYIKLGVAIIATLISAYILFFDKKNLIPEFKKD